MVESGEHRDPVSILRDLAALATEAADLIAHAATLDDHDPAREADAQRATDVLNVFNMTVAELDDLHVAIIGDT